MLGILLEMGGQGGARSSRDKALPDSKALEAVKPYLKLFANRIDGFSTPEEAALAAEAVLDISRLVLARDRTKLRKELDRSAVLNAFYRSTGENPLPKLIHSDTQQTLLSSLDAILNLTAIRFESSWWESSARTAAWQQIQKLRRSGEELRELSEFRGSLLMPGNIELAAPLGSQRVYVYDPNDYRTVWEVVGRSGDGLLARPIWDDDNSTRIEPGPPSFCPGNHLSAASVYHGVDSIPSIARRTFALAVVAVSIGRGLLAKEPSPDELIATRERLFARKSWIA